MGGVPETKVDILDLPIDFGDHLAREWAVMRK